MSAPQSKRSGDRLRRSTSSFDKGSDDPAKALVHDLLKIHVDAGPNERREIIGEFVEPIQLQVVCQNMWRNFPDELKAYAAGPRGLRREKKIITRDQIKSAMWIKRSLSITTL